MLLDIELRRLGAQHEPKAAAPVESRLPWGLPTTSLRAARTIEGRTTSRLLTLVQNHLVRCGGLCKGGARCEYRGEKAFCIIRPDTPSLSNLPIHPLEI